MKEWDNLAEWMVDNKLFSNVRPTICTILYIWTRLFVPEDIVHRCACGWVGVLSVPIRL